MPIVTPPASPKMLNAPPAPWKGKQKVLNKAQVAVSPPAYSLDPGPGVFIPSKAPKGRRHSAAAATLLKKIDGKLVTGVSLLKALDGVSVFDSDNEADITVTKRSRSDSMPFVGSFAIDPTTNASPAGFLTPDPGDMLFEILTKDKYKEILRGAQSRLPACLCVFVGNLPAQYSDPVLSCLVHVAFKEYGACYAAVFRENGAGGPDRPYAIVQYEREMDVAAAYHCGRGKGIGTRAFRVEPSKRALFVPYL